MDTIFINTKSSGAKESHVFKSQLPGEINLGLHLKTYNCQM